MDIRGGCCTNKNVEVSETVSIVRERSGWAVTRIRWERKVKRQDEKNRTT